MDPYVYAAFADELLKTAGIWGSAAKTLGEFATAGGRKAVGVVKGMGHAAADTVNPAAWKQGIQQIKKDGIGVNNAMLLGLTPLGLYTDLKSTDFDGRKKGWGERALGAAGTIGGTLGGFAINQRHPDKFIKPLIYGAGGSMISQGIFTRAGRGIDKLLGPKPTKTLSAAPQAFSGVGQ